MIAAVDKRAKAPQDAESLCSSTAQDVHRVQVLSSPYQAWPVKGYPQKMACIYISSITVLLKLSSLLFILEPFTADWSFFGQNPFCKTGPGLILAGFPSNSCQQARGAWWTFLLVSTSS
jgi:hypothetical protein